MTKPVAPHHVHRRIDPALLDEVANDARGNGRDEHDDAAAKVPLKATHADDIGPDMMPPPQVVEDMLCEGEVCVWFGPSQAGKTTLMAQLCMSVALGIDFLGKRTRQGAVVYVAAEVPGNVMRRIRGAKEHFNYVHMPLTVVREAIDLFEGLADVARLVAFVQAFAAQSGEPVKLIVIDTLARSCGDADENSTRDMGIVMRNLTNLANATGACVAVVHHTGNADASRSRGSSVIYSNADVEVLCEHDRPQDLRLLTMKKQRNLGTDGMKLAARFVRVDIGVDEWLKPLTASAVEPAEMPDGTAVCKRLGEVEGAVIEFLAAHRVGIKKRDVVKHFEGRYEKGPVYRAMKTLHTAHAIHEAAGMVCIAEAAK
ncbi:hypothetical protein AWB67_00972 [Caballeronia terrestris]|uniref:AAA+ ATPase domain-containing protein n=1 Tax=Caballeronia terrestris TaxID=1226301 RepID=A0A158FYM6_9BURK|nr:AAA family ATPase [Caballeronia terrestris]SAL24944.1 hypothetical protein AWB67_00972 [Caballeronia terrestris]